MNNNNGEILLEVLVIDFVMTSMLEFHSFPLPYKRLQVLHSVLVKGLHIELLLSYGYNNE